MTAIWNWYLRFTIRTRIFLLCFCYSLCIIAVGIVARTQSLAVTICTIILFVIAGQIFGAINMWGITSSISRVLAYLKEMTDGNLMREIEVKRNNEISEVLRAIRQVQLAMRKIISGIKTASNHVTSSSDHLGKSSAVIADSTENAASQTLSVSNAIDDLASVSSNISDNCIKMSELASDVQQASCEGEQVISGMSVIMDGIEQVMNETTEAVRSLGDNSTRIGDILATIGDIADQTNLLALNAAIEAARAGDQGRGFAVVADEVRSLADRTTSATREIQTIINALQRDVKNVIGSMQQSSGNVREGGAGVQRSCEAIGSITRQIGMLHENVSYVATAATEQSSTTANMRQNIHHISAVISEAATGAHQTRSAASELAASATELQQMVSSFQL